jgi:hypothetical protein
MATSCRAFISPSGNVALISEFAERIRRTFDDDPRFCFVVRGRESGGPNDL